MEGHRFVPCFRYLEIESAHSIMVEGGSGAVISKTDPNGSSAARQQMLEEGDINPSKFLIYP